MGGGWWVVVVVVVEGRGEGCARPQAAVMECDGGKEGRKEGPVGKDER